MKLLPLFAFLLLIGSSCTIKQNFTFDQDFGGQLEMQVDMSKMMAMGGGEAKSLLDSVNTDSIVDQMNSQAGISATRLEETEGIVRFGYKFEDLKSLNEANQDDGSMAKMLGGDVKEGQKQEPLFTWSKGVLSYDPPAYEKPEGETETDEASESMEAMMKYEVVMNFAKPVKEVSNSAYIVSEDQKSISYSATISDVYEGNSGATTVKF